MKVTYLLHLRVVLVLTMVQSRPHHLRHQWSQISTCVSLNHIHHHTYFKSSYIHIQVFHILHHHTMKLFLTFRSFQPRRPIVGSLQAANSAAKTGFLQAPQFWQWITNSMQNTSFGRGCQFAGEDTASTANHNFAVEHTILQRMLFRCSRHSFGSESQFHRRTRNPAANVLWCRGRTN